MVRVFRAERLNLVSAEADLLNERHTSSPIADVMTAQQFMEADYFLFLRSVFQNQEQRFNWYPHSTLYLRQTPRFLVEAERLKNAQRLLAPLAVDSIEEFRRLYSERSGWIRMLFTKAFFLDLPGVSALQIGSRA